MDSVASFFWTEDSNDKNIDAKGSDNLANKGGNSKANKATSSNMNKSRSNRSINGSSVSLSKTISNENTSSTLQQMMTDTLVEKIIKMALPPSSVTAKTTIANRMAYSKNRPSLSVPIMSKNFILMNSRLGIPFMIIDGIIQFCNWDNIPFTLCGLFIYTFFVLKPFVTLTCGPIFYILFGIMVPQYLHIHKPNLIPDNLLDSNLTPAPGPPLKKSVLPEPVPELSQEFVLNLTDLQNHILLYVIAYDFICGVLEKFAYFLNEQISALVFVSLLSIALFNFLFIEQILPWIPIKFILIVLGWSSLIALHPRNRDRILKSINSEETRLHILGLTRKYENIINEHLRYIEAREHKVVIIYEIQKYKEKYKEWRPVGYCDDDYSLFSKLRINEVDLRNNCSKTLEEIQPPVEWEWTKNSNWTLDLDPKEWVQENFLQYVEIDVETKWVYDLDIEGRHGAYRRRMWTNTCTRKADIEVSRQPLNDAAHDSFNDGSSTIEEVVNPLREDSYSQSKTHGIARGSMSGNIALHNDADLSELSAISSISGEGSVNGISDMTDILNTAM